MLRSEDGKANKEKITYTKNVFTLQQVKKMIGKKLIVLMVNRVVTVQDKNSAKILKAKILEQHSIEKSSKCKNMIITTMYNDGILYVFKNIDIYLAIGYISYKEMVGIGDTITVIVQQYPKLSKSDLKKIM